MTCRKSINLLNLQNSTDVQFLSLLMYSYGACRSKIHIGFLHFTAFNVPLFLVPTLVSLLILQSPAVAATEQYISILWMNISWCHFFHVEEFNSIPLLHLHFHVRGHFVRLPLCFHLSHGIKM